MSIFWISTLALLLISSMAMALPLWKSREQNDEARRDELNKAFYQDRLVELAEEESAGLVNDQDELIIELKQSLLDDIPEKKRSQVSKIEAKWFILPSLLVFFVVTYAFYFKFGNLDKVEKWHQATENFPYLAEKIMNPQGEGLTMSEMTDFTLALRTKLHEQPNNPQEWLFLGRISMNNRDIDTALSAMKKAYQLDSTNVEIMIVYAQALMLSGTDNAVNQGRYLLGQVLHQEPTNLQALSLVGFSAYERGDYQGAASAWQQMLSQLTPDDSRYEMLKQSIKRAKSQTKLR